jgi:hypothetical protein
MKLFNAMKKYLCLILMIVGLAFAGSKPIRIEVQRPDWNSPAVYILEDVRNYQWIADRTVLRVWFYSGYVLDLPIGNYEVKINK